MPGHPDILLTEKTPVPGHTGHPLTPTDALPLGPLPGSRYPDPHIEAIDRKRFKGSPGTGAVERVATGFRWAEGPAYFRAGNYLIFSDIPNNRQMRLLAEDNHLSVFRSPSLNSNGNTVDRQGRLISCQHATRSVVRTEFDGKVYHPRRPLQRQAFERPERRGGRVRRLDLVHRPHLRHRRQLRGASVAAGAADPERLPLRS